MSFRSILFGSSDVGDGIDEPPEPEPFRDLNLDQVVASITLGREEYRLKPFLHLPLQDARAVNDRQDVFRDLEDGTLRAHVASFAKQMRAMRDDISQVQRRRYALQKQWWFLHAVETYCSAVVRLAEDLAGSDPRSRGFLALVEYLATYTASPYFTSLRAETQRLKEDLSGVRYSLHLSGVRIRVSRYDAEPDYGAEVERTFEKFQQGAGREYRFSFSSGPDMNHVEAAILDRVALLFPEAFASLDRFCDHHRGYVDDRIVRFDREVQFYLAYLEHIERLKATGLPFTYPEVAVGTRSVEGREVFDLALANKLFREHASIITNDFSLEDPERVLVVSGPNQGGKTTFARTFGQIHYLAALGCPVPGSRARLSLFDRLFSHFEREEDLQDLSGKLEDDLLRIHAILADATADSILIMNESFTSTTLQDALALSRRVMDQVVERDMLCVSVTFLDELASLGPSVVSMVGAVDPDDPARRTFKLERRPADGLAYALAIAEKHHLTYDSLTRRLAS